MATQVYLICAACRHALALEWDASCFLVDDPLGGRDSVEFEVAGPALIYGTWPQEKPAPAPLIDGVWAALATRASSFVRRHLAHSNAAGIVLARELPTGGILDQTEPFMIPVGEPSPQSIDTALLRDVRNLSLEQKLNLAACIGAKRLWEMVADETVGVPDGLLLFGWLPGDAGDDERLLTRIPDTMYGHIAEEALAVRIVLGTNDPVPRRQRLLAVAESAYARRGQFWARVRETPYDRAAPLGELQAGAVERLVAAGYIEQACELAIRCAVPETKLSALREPLSECILDRALPDERRLRLILHARNIFHGLISVLRRKRGLAGDPLPSLSSWPVLEGAARTMACLCAAPDAVRAALLSTDVAMVIEGLEMIKGLASIVPEDTVAFSAEVLALCRDSRMEPKPVQTRLCARARDVHSLIFAALDGAGAWEALNEVIDAMLTTGLGLSLGMHFRALGANRIPVAQVGALLVGRVADRNRPVKERIQAREALSILASEAASVQRNQPVPSPEGQDAARQADDLLIAALHDPAEPAELKSAVRSAIMRWMPDRIPELQGTVIDRVTVPSISTLVPGQSIAGIDKNEVFALLNDPDADPDRVLGAIALAEPFVRMKPELGPRLESLLRRRIADNRQFSERAWNRTVAVEAWLAHRMIWQLLKPDKRPAAIDLLISFREIAMAQEAPSQGERSLAAALAETVNACLTPSDFTQIAAGLETDIANRRLRPWTRLHSYNALATLKDQGGRAEKVLYAALADSGEDPVLRAEAHVLLAPRLPKQVYDLQARGVLSRPSIPPVETLFHNLPLFERDTEGEWVLTPEAIRLSRLVYPEDLIATLHNSKSDPSRACAAAALAPLVAERLPDLAGQLAGALRDARDERVALPRVIAGREHTFGLAGLCADGLQAMGRN